MIQNKRFGSGLKEYVSNIPIVDTSSTSDQYFRLIDVPDKLYVGKNSFKLKSNPEMLVAGAMIYIDIIDANGKIIYHEVSEIVSESESRTIIVHVYEDTPPGEARILIASRAKYSMYTGAAVPYTRVPGNNTHIDVPNVIWIGKCIVVPTAATIDKVVFATPPIVTVTKRTLSYLTISNTPGGSRLTHVSGSWDITAATPTKILSGISGHSNDLSGNSTPSNGSSNNFTYISDTSGRFTPDYVGGQIVIRDLATVLGIRYPIPDYSSTVYEVVDAFNVKVYPPFSYMTSQGLITGFSHAYNVTSSYYVVSKAEMVEQYASQSYLQLDFEQLEPIIGVVDSIDVTYKEFGSFGSFVPLGNFKLLPQEYLIDSGSSTPTQEGIVELPIGNFSGSVEFTEYWDLFPGSNEVAVEDSILFQHRGVQVLTRSPINELLNYQYEFAPKSAYNIHAIKNTEYKLSVCFNYEEIQTYSQPVHIDIYIDGPPIIRDTINDTNTTTFNLANNRGIKIGSIIEDIKRRSTSESKVYDFYFKALETGFIRPYFVVNNLLKLNVRNISIVPRSQLGYSANQARLYIPFNTLKQNVELLLNVKYLNLNKQESEISNTLQGIYVTGGGNTEIINQVINAAIRPIDVTYSELVNLIQTSGLTPGSQYKLTDFRTIHYLFDESRQHWADGAETATINTGPIEPLLLFANSHTELGVVAKSLTYPQDIIHYDWNPDNWLQDAGLSDVQGMYTFPNESVFGEIIPGFRGVITYREDTVQNNIAHFDFRHAKFRRWAADIPAEWNSATQYVRGDLVHLINGLHGFIYGTVYVALRDNQNQMPNSWGSNEYWVPILEFPANESTEQYWNWSSDRIKLKMDTTLLYGRSPYNIELFSTADYIDTTLFGDDLNYANCFNNYIGSNKPRNMAPIDYGIDPMTWERSWGCPTIFSNVVFYGPTYNNRITAPCSLNTFGIGINSSAAITTNPDSYYPGSSHNTINGLFNRNLVSYCFSNNTIMSWVTNNIFGSYFMDNMISTRFDSNAIGGSCAFNEFSIHSGVPWIIPYPYLEEAENFL